MPKTIGPFLAGSYQITQRFGQNPQTYAQFGMAGHDGIDLATPNGTLIYAGVNGRVLSLGEDPGGFGKWIKVFDPSQNVVVLFAHLSSYATGVHAGLDIFKGTPLCKSGNTGFSTGPHLHLGVADTDMSGNKINRANGYDGWEDPQDRSKFTLLLFGSSATPASTPSGASQPPSDGGDVYTGPTPPPYSPSFAGQTVSHLGNSFRSDNGSIWIFQGSDAERKAASDAIHARELAQAEAAAVESGVYLQKSNLLKKFDNININASDYGLADAEYVIIRGPYKATLYDKYRGEGNVIATFSTPGTHRIPNSRVGSVRAEVILPPAPRSLPNTPVTPTSTTPPVMPTPAPETTPSSGVDGTEPWAGTRAPTHKQIYNKLVELFRRIL